MCLFCYYLYRLFVAGPQYYSSQTMYTPSPSIIVPTPQQPPPTKREKKTVSVFLPSGRTHYTQHAFLSLAPAFLCVKIRIRDPNQGGKDITDEIMSGVGGSRNTTPPVARPSSTPTPPQVRHTHTHFAGERQTDTSIWLYFFTYLILVLLLLLLSLTFQIQSACFLY